MAPDLKALDYKRLDQAHAGHLTRRQNGQPFVDSGLNSWYHRGPAKVDHLEAAGLLVWVEAENLYRPTEEGDKVRAAHHAAKAQARGGYGEVVVRRGQ